MKRLTKLFVSYDGLEKKNRVKLVGKKISAESVKYRFKGLISYWKLMCFKIGHCKYYFQCIHELPLYYIGSSRIHVGYRAKLVSDILGSKYALARVSDMAHPWSLVNKSH